MDLLFNSVADHWPDPGVAVLLTGMGRDGAAGLLRLRRQRWHTIAQDEASSIVYGMPRAAVEIGAAVEVLPVSQIAAAILASTPAAAVGCVSQTNVGRIPGGAPSMSAEPKLTEHKITVFLIDDQPLIGEAVRRMLAGEPDLAFHFCKDAARALEVAGTVGPTVILQDLVMPDIDGLTLVKMFRANEPTRETPLIVLSTKEEPTTKAEAFALGANDYIVKLPDKIELLARIRYHSKGYINLLQRNEAYQALQAEPADAGQRRVPGGAIRPLAAAGEAEHGLDPDRLAVHSLDRPGRRLVRLRLDRRRALRLLPARRQRPRRRRRLALGLGAERPPVAVAAADRLPPAGPGPRRPEPGVPDGPAERALLHDLVRHLFTRPRGGSTTPGGGHPPALLLTGPTPEQATMKVLGSQGPMIGADVDMTYETESCTVDDFGRLFLFSDGVYEITRTDSTMWPFHDFIAFMGRGPEPGESDSTIDRLIDQTVRLGGTDEYQDDFSIVEFQFQGPA